MTFIWPVMFVSLLAAPLLIGLYLRQQRRKRQTAQSFAALGFGQASAGRRPGFRRHIPPALFLLGLLILGIGLTRPQTTVSLPRIEGTVMLVFDVSGSMAADDLKPSRMEAAKAAARDFIQRQPRTVQVGVVAFSDGGLAVQAPTNDQDTLLAAINRLSPQRGTSIGGGILAALNAIASDKGQAPRLYSSIQPTAQPTPTPVPQGTYTNAVIVLLSDGENNAQPDPMNASQTAADRGVRIYTIGIGSAAGTTLHVNGFTVFTTLDEAGLQEISKLTGGTYFNAGNEQDLRDIYNNLNPQLVVKPEKLEVTALFASAGILVMLIGGTFSFLWFNRLP